MRNFLDSFNHAPELLRLLSKNASVDAIDDWMKKRGYRYSNSAIKETFRMANREDLIPEFIQEEDVQIGDYVKSKYSSRIGKVIGMHHVGDILEVKWETGGRQLIPRESVYKLLHKDVSENYAKSDFAKIRQKLDLYKDMRDK